MNIDVFLWFKEQNKWQGSEVQGWKSLSATVFHSLSPSQTCSLRREVVCVFRGGTGQGARQSQALTKSSSTRSNLSDRDTSCCHLCLSRMGHSWGHHPQGEAFPCATRQSTDEQNISAPKRGWQPKGLPCHGEQNQERWEFGRKNQ